MTCSTCDGSGYVVEGDNGPRFSRYECETCGRYAMRAQRDAARTALAEVGAAGER